MIKNKPSIFILSIFPDVVSTVLGSSILRRAQMGGKVHLEALDLRTFAKGHYKAVDDSPFGGEQGMLFRLDVLASVVDHLRSLGWGRSQLKVIYLSPRGLEFRQEQAWALAKWLISKEDLKAIESKPEESQGEVVDSRGLLFICGRYEGVDDRFIQRFVDLEISMGDFIVTGGELPSLVILDSIVRLLPGVLGNDQSAKVESFSNGLLEYPQYTRPREYEGLSVPAVLTEGNHKKIEEYKLRESLALTFAFRPDLIREHTGQGLPSWAKELLVKLKQKLDSI